MVRMEGLEPPRLSALEPKSSVSTNSTTSATCLYYKLDNNLCPLNQLKNL